MLVVLLVIITVGLFLVIISILPGSNQLALPVGNSNSPVPNSNPPPAAVQVTPAMVEQTVRVDGGTICIREIPSLKKGAHH